MSDGSGWAPARDVMDRFRGVGSVGSDASVGLVEGAEGVHPVLSAESTESVDQRCAEVQRPVVQPHRAESLPEGEQLDGDEPRVEPGMCKSLLLPTGDEARVDRDRVLVALREVGGRWMIRRRSLA